MHESEDVRIVRDDLWRAMTDLKSDSPYVWDGVQARPRYENEDAALLLPTLSEQEMNEIRQSFAQQNPTLDFELWKRRRYAPRSMPRHLSHSWTITIQSSVIDRLERWFTDNGIDIPNDLYEVKDRNPRLNRTSPESNLDSLRIWFIKCIMDMNHDELSALKLIASAAFRQKNG